MSHHPNSFVKLTPTEIEIGNLIVLMGWSNVEIARHMKRSVDTINKHIQNIYGKTNLRRATLWQHFYKGELK